MFREMRRFKQLLSEEEIKAIMERNTNGILACMGDNGYPYGVPVNYVYHNGKVYFHSSKKGHKIDAIKTNTKVSFTVVDQDKIVPEEYTSYFRSVVAFGNARITEGDEWREGFQALIDKYTAELPPDRNKRELDNCTGTLIVAIDIDHITGKEAIEIINERKAAEK